MTSTDALEQARDPHTPADQLARLAGHEDGAVRVAVAANPSTSRATVEELLHATGDGMEAEVLTAVLSNPSLALWLLEDPAWLHSLASWKIHEMARLPSFPTIVWDVLRTHPDVEVRMALMHSSGAPPQAWRQFGFPTEPDALLASLDVWTEEVGPDEGRSQTLLDRFLAHPEVPDRLRAAPSWLRLQTGLAAHVLARSTALTPALWEALHRNESLHVRLGLLGSPVAPPDAWIRLALPGGGAWDLHHSGLINADLELLARSPDVTAITQLNLASNMLEDSGLLAMIHSPNFPLLTVLDLSNNMISTEAICELARSASFPALNDLNLGRCVVCSEGLAALAHSISFPHLTHLRLACSFIGDADVVELARTTSLRLALLDLSDNATVSGGGGSAVGNAGAIALSRSAALTGLTHLDLSKTQVSDEGALALTRAPFFPHLTVLRLADCPLSLEGREALQAAAARFPRLTLVLDRP